MNIVTVLFSNTKTSIPAYSSKVGYSPEWMDKLVSAVERNSSQRNSFFCLVDNPNYTFRENVQPILLQQEISGWSAMMEALRPDICSGHRMVLGLDTIICNSIESILQWNGDCGLLDDPLNPGELCNGVGIYSQSCAGRLWHLWQNRDRLFTKEELYYVPDYEIGKISHKQGYLSEMAFLRTVMHQQAARLNRIFPNQIQSYKVHWKESGRQMKNQASIIYFHGNPKPPKVEQELLEHWV